MSEASLKFLGAVGTVTGSKYLLERDDTRLLVDCGLFQGFKKLRLRNWAPVPFDPGGIAAVALTHAHLDHSGYLPLLIKRGFDGPIIATGATRDLCAILLPDSGFLQEKDAEFANRHGFSKHKPALPLYTRSEAEASLDHFSTVEFGNTHDVGGVFALRFLPAGHILGASIIEVTFGGTKVVFSGDLGRPDNAITLAPTKIKRADYLVVESTYGDRLHDSRDAEDALAKVINKTISRGGTVVIPSFAVGRAQSLMFHIQQLKQDDRIPGNLPVFLDSPMAENVSDVFCNHVSEHRLTPAQCRAACNVATYVRDVEGSKALDADPMPKVVISASGMATGGRVLHHLKRYAPDHRSTILFAGFQAGGTRGAAMVGGADRIKIHGGYVPVHASVEILHMLSAHADSNEIMAWLGGFEAPPKMTFVTHGEPQSADALRHRIEEELGWPCDVPEYRDEVELR